MGLLAGQQRGRSWRAQQPERVRQVTIWMGCPNDAEGERLHTAFRQGLVALGRSGGYNIQTNDVDRRALAKAVVDQQPEVIVALLLENGTVPIVFVNVSDPIGGGFCHKPGARRHD